MKRLYWCNATLAHRSPIESVFVAVVVVVVVGCSKHSIPNLFLSLGAFHSQFWLWHNRFSVVSSVFACKVRDRFGVCVLCCIYFELLLLPFYFSLFLFITLKIYYTGSFVRCAVVFFWARIEYFRCSNKRSFIAVVSPCMIFVFFASKMYLSLSCSLSFSLSLSFSFISATHWPNVCCTYCVCNSSFR